MNAAIFFAERLGAIRALTSEETDVLERAMSRCRLSPRRLWTAKEDRELLRAMRMNPRGYAVAHAEMSGRSVWAVRSRARKVGK